MTSISSDVHSLSLHDALPISPVPRFQNPYWVMVSPSGSLALNSDAAAKLCPWVAERFETETVGWGSANMLTVEAWVHGPQTKPSLARTHSVSVDEPA